MKNQLEQKSDKKDVKWKKIPKLLLDFQIKNTGNNQMIEFHAK